MCFWGTPIAWFLAEICKQPIALNSNLSASSEYGKKDATHAYGAERGYLDTKEEVINGVTEIGGWAAATNDQNQYIQVRLQKSRNSGSLFGITKIRRENKIRVVILDIVFTLT